MMNMPFLAGINSLTGRFNTALFHNLAFVIFVPIIIVLIWCVSKTRNRIRSKRGSKYEIISTNKWYKEKENNY